MMDDIEQKKDENQNKENSPVSEPMNLNPASPDLEVKTSQITRKKINWKKVFFVGIAIILVVLIIFILTDVINLKPVEKKESLNISYTIYSDGLPIDYKNAIFAKNTISQNLNLVSNKLDEEINKLNIGEEKNITLEAKEAYGEYDSGKIFYYERTEKQNRTNEMNKTAWIAVSDFTNAFNEQPILNKEYSLSGAPWPYKVLEINSSHVKLSQEAALNSEVPFGMFSYKVIEVTNEKIKLKIFGNDTIVPTENGNYIVNFTEEEIITTFAPEINQEIELTNFPKARVTGMNSTRIFLDANNLYAGKIILVQVKLIDKKIEKISTTGSVIKHVENAPVMQVFIMSHCPYGTQIVKGLLPVWEKFKDKANIELRFVSYTMHGAQEELDNNRIICIREEQSQKLIDYLKCFVYGSGNEESSQSCIKSTGIDQNKLTSCLNTGASGQQKSKVAEYMEIDKTLNTQYGVQGSPTIIIDGKESSIYPRDPANVAKALCSAFTGSKPAECSLTFDTTNPSPGFGSGSGSSSSSGGSCS